MVELVAVPATIGHARALAPRLREEDARECLDLGGQTSEEALVSSVEASLWALTALRGGTPVAMFGVIPYTVLGGVGIAWMLGARECRLYPTLMVKAGRRAVRRMLDTFPEVVNVIDSRYACALRWARLLGFEVLDEVALPIGALGRPIRARR